MERLKIVLLCVVGAVFYGIIHDQITARICIEYFTVFHPPMFLSRSPTVLGFEWGVAATWWAGAMIGVSLASAAQSGSKNRLAARDLAPKVLVILGFMAICAATAGFIGFHCGVMPDSISEMLPVTKHRHFLADWWAHMASYGSGFLGGAVLFVWVIWHRINGRHIRQTDEPTKNPDANSSQGTR